jgi:hypothetical protein
MKHRSLIALFLVGILMMSAGTAYAAPKVKQPQPVYTMTSNVEVTGETVFMDEFGRTITKQASSVDDTMLLGSGTGGYVAYSGYRRIKVTAYLHLWDTRLVAYQPSFYYEFKGGKVTNSFWEGSRFINYGLFGVVFQHAGETTTGPYLMTYNGITSGQVYGAKTGNIEFRVTKYGVFYSWYPIIKVWGRGNGTYSWSCSW